MLVGAGRFPFRVPPPCWLPAQMFEKVVSPATASQSNIKPTSDASEPPADVVQEMLRNDGRCFCGYRRITAGRHEGRWTSETCVSAPGLLYQGTVPWSNKLFIFVACRVFGRRSEDAAPGWGRTPKMLRPLTFHQAVPPTPPAPVTSWIHCDSSDSKRKRNIRFNRIRHFMTQKWIMGIVCSVVALGLADRSQLFIGHTDAAQQRSWAALSFSRLSCVDSIWKNRHFHPVEL